MYQNELMSHKAIKKKTAQSKRLHTAPIVSIVPPVIQRTVKEDIPKTALRDYGSGSIHGIPCLKISEIQNQKDSGLTGSVPDTGLMNEWFYIQACHMSDFWVNFHLINDNLGGSGHTIKNLVVASKKANSDWLSFETAVKNTYNQGHWIWCIGGVASYYSPILFGNICLYFPRQIIGDAQYFDSGQSAWLSIAVSKNTTLCDPPPTLPYTPSNLQIYLPRRKSRKKLEWTTPSDSFLTYQVNLYGTNNWSRVADAFGNFVTRAECRTRWVNGLSPDIIRTRFTPEEDTLLLKLRDDGLSWSQIAAQMKGRTVVQLRYHFNMLDKVRHAKAPAASPTAHTELT